MSERNAQFSQRLNVFVKGVLRHAVGMAELSEKPQNLTVPQIYRWQFVGKIAGNCGPPLPRSESIGCARGRDGARNPSILASPISAFPFK
jgi:hypothetical protein